MSQKNFQRYGQAEPPVALIPLRAGPLEMLLDPTTGFLRRIKYGSREVLRGIYAAVRDQNWGTVVPTLRFEKQRIGPDSFHVEFACDHRQGDIDFGWRGIVTGETDGTLSYQFDGGARTAFLKNRIGFCVLYPICECAGEPARQWRTDGLERDARFPDLIEPQIFGQSSFQQLRGIRHEVAPGCEARVDFSGDIFEMEDQRNWTDASFKVYCTPLLEPFPVAIAPGHRVRQEVTLRLNGTAGAIHREANRFEAAGELTLKLPDGPTGSLPELGLGVASHGEPLTALEVDRLRGLQLSHLRVDVHLAAADAAASLRRAMGDAAQLGMPLELALHLPSTGEVDPRQLRSVLEQGSASVRRVLALREGEPATTPETLAWVRRNFGDLGARIGVGSDCNFRELNHAHALHHLGLDGADFIFWSVNPQVHAVDRLSIMETLEAQPATARTARALAGGRPLVVSPVTLRQRFNPVATGPELASTAGELPTSVDPRQLSHFAAAWTLGSIAAWTSAQVGSVTFYETSGWRGVMERAGGSPLPDKFPSAPGEIFPLYHVFTGLAGFKQTAVARAGPADEIVAVALFSSTVLRRVLIANLSSETQHVEVEGWPGQLQLELSPYEVRRLDVAG